MMKILVAPDSFKGSLSALELCRIVKKSIHRVMKDAEVLEVPISDGGEGFLESISAFKKMDLVEVMVKDPLGKKIPAEMGLDTKSKTAFIEMARCSGLTLLLDEERNPLQSFSYGVGELIKHALDLGYQNFILGLGGSATNDAGIGMLLELGVEFLDENGEILTIQSILDIGKIASIHMGKVDPRVLTSQFILATDVNNPLCGKQGATYVFGPQKGVASNKLSDIDSSIFKFGKLLEKQFSMEIVNVPGAGAAGGIAAACLAFLNAEIKPGIEMIIDTLNLPAIMESVDFIITGEGKLDSQTLNGKVIHGICELAKQIEVPVIAICGMLLLSPKEVRELGLQAAFSISKGPSTVEESIDNGEILVSEMVENLMALYRLSLKHE